MDVNTEECVELQHHCCPHNDRVHKQPLVGDAANDNHYGNSDEHKRKNEEYYEQRESSIASKVDSFLCVVCVCVCGVV